MIPPNVHPTLFHSNDSDYILFKTAIYFAELGLNVWFISPTVFDKVPENVISPDKETLKLITFVYLQDYKSLLNHLNAIHLWHKMPRIIILSGFETYTNLFTTKYDPLLSAIVICTVLDSASVCFKKNQESIFVIVSTQEAQDSYIDRFQVLYDMYFPHFINKNDKTVIVGEIVNYYSNK